MQNGIIDIIPYIYVPIRIVLTFRLQRICPDHEKVYNKEKTIPLKKEHLFSLFFSLSHGGLNFCNLECRKLNFSISFFLLVLPRINVTLCSEPYFFFTPTHGRLVSTLLWHTYTHMICLQPKHFLFGLLQGSQVYYFSLIDM